MLLKEIIGNFKDYHAAWADRWGLAEEPNIVRVLINVVNSTLTRYRNFEVAYASRDEFEVAFNNVLDRHTPTLLNRARYLHLNFAYLKNPENWENAGGSSTDFSNKNTMHQGYQGYNAQDDEAFKKDWADAQGLTAHKNLSNPMLLAQTFKEAFTAEVRAFEHDIEALLCLIY